METSLFISNYRKAFGKAELPIAFWYSDSPATLVTKTRGCFMGYLSPARKGGIVSFDAEAISCPGGKTYAGFTPAPPFIPGFVSGKECYKETPEQVSSFIEKLQIPEELPPYLNFASAESVDNLEETEGIAFFASPDILSGLISWTQFDSDAPDAVSVPFGSGCSSLVSQTIAENRRNGKRSFLGFFDPSVRPVVEPDILCFAIPLSRFREMYYTMDKSCLKGTHGWERVRKRITNV